MAFSLLPRHMTDALTDVSADFLQSCGIRLLMLDFDNTVVPYTTDIPEEQVLKWLEQMRYAGIELCVVSNSHKGRALDFCRKYGIGCITHAKKPFTRGIRECMEKNGVTAQDSALVGDQIFTDVLGANCAGVRSILVRSIDNHNFWLKLRHVAELPFIFAARKRRIGT